MSISKKPAKKISNNILLSTPASTMACEIDQSPLLSGECVATTSLAQPRTATFFVRDYWSIPKAFRSHAERENLIDSLGKAQTANDDAIQRTRNALDRLVEDGKVIAARLVLAGVTPVRKVQKAES